MSGGSGGAQRAPGSMPFFFITRAMSQSSLSGPQKSRRLDTNTARKPFGCTGQTLLGFFAPVVATDASRIGRYFLRLGMHYVSDGPRRPAPGWTAVRRGAPGSSNATLTPIGDYIEQDP